MKIITLSGNQRIKEIYQKLPEFNFDFSKIKVTKFTHEILQNLKLNLRVTNKIGLERVIEFDETISYDPKMRKRFVDVVKKKRGYLDEESNYFDIEERHLSTYDKAVILRNCRAILYLKGANLSYINIQRILTLGLSFLLNEMNEAELIYAIRRLLPNGTFEVVIGYKKDTFVSIGITEPLLKF